MCWTPVADELFVVGIVDQDDALTDDVHRNVAHLAMLKDSMLYEVDVPRKMQLTR